MHKTTAFMWSAIFVNLPSKLQICYQFPLVVNLSMKCEQNLSGLVFANGLTISKRSVVVLCSWGQRPQTVLLVIQSCKLMPLLLLTVSLRAFEFWVKFCYTFDTLLTGELLNVHATFQCFSVDPIQFFSLNRCWTVEIAHRCTHTSTHGVIHLWIQPISCVQTSGDSD